MNAFSWLPVTIWLQYMYIIQCNIWCKCILSGDSMMRCQIDPITKLISQYKLQLLQGLAGILSCLTMFLGTLLPLDFSTGGRELTRSHRQLLAFAVVYGLGFGGCYSLLSAKPVPLTIWNESAVFQEKKTGLKNDVYITYNYIDYSIHMIYKISLCSIGIY